MTKRCAQCQGELIGTELAFNTCGDCGGRWRIRRRPIIEPERRRIRDVITDAVDELIRGADK